MEISQTLRGLGGRLGLPDLCLDSNNACALIFDASCMVDLHYAETDHTLHLSSILGAIRPTEKPDLLRALLEANNDVSALGEAHFAVDVPRGEVVMCRAVPAGALGVETLSDALTVLVEACQRWSGQLAHAGYIQAR